VKQPEGILAELSIWLGLEQALTPNYYIFNRTGATGAGDPSANIKEGKIIQTSKHENIELDKELLSKAIELYRVCKKDINSKQV